MFDLSEVGGVLSCLILSYYYYYDVDHDLVFCLLILCSESECILLFFFYIYRLFDAVLSLLFHYLVFGGLKLDVGVEVVWG